jgi:F-type H+-transporting ATPase subunit delta
MNGTPIDKNVAKKYAQAFMTVFPKSCAFTDIKKIESAQKFLQTHKRTLFFLQLPQFDQERKKSMVADLIDYFSLPHDFAAIILLLIEHDRSFYIPDVLLWISQLYKNEIHSSEFSIMSAHELDDAQIEAIKKFLGHLANKKIIGNPSVDTSLIAGLRLQSNEHLWEYSIRKQLKALQALKR